MASERIVKLSDVDPENVAYFSLILIPDSRTNRQSHAMNGAGRITVVGLGPGSADWITPEAQQALADATDLVGYHTYLDRVPVRPGQCRYGS